MAREFEVHVGGIGRVYVGESKEEADLVFDEYVLDSRTCPGRAYGESVTMLAFGEGWADMVREHEGHLRDG